MNNSGIKRGLASTAIAALAVAGLPLLAGTAHADSFAEQFTGSPTAVVLYAPYSGNASVATDGVDQTVHLLAGGGANVVSVEFRANGTAIGTTRVSRANGVFSLDWTPSATLYNTNVLITAVGYDATGNPIVGSLDTETVALSPSASAVHIANAPASQVGVYRQPYGVTNDQDGQTNDLEIGVINGTATAGETVTPQNLTTGSPTGAPVAGTKYGTASGGIRTFKAGVDFTGYTYDATAPIVNDAVVGADVPGSDDAQPVALYTQTITTVTAAPEAASVQGSATTNGLVTVLDQNGKPIAGAQVIADADKDGVWDAAEDEYYTDVDGVATVPGLTGSAGGTSYDFFVNTDDGDNYNAATDFKRSVTVTSYAATATTLTLASKDGSAFDVTENAAGDLNLTVKDQNGAGLAGQNVQAKVVFTPFNGGAPTTQAVAVSGGASGVYNLAFTDLGDGTYVYTAWIEKDGTPGQTAGDLSATDLTVKAGDTQVTWNDGSVAQAQAGTTTTLTGKLALADGTVLANRSVSFSYAPADNSKLAAQADQPAGTTRTSDTTGSTKSGTDGTFKVAIVDPSATPQPKEIGSSLTATSTDTGGEAASIDLDFLNTAVSATNTTVATDDLTADGATPGRPVAVQITVENADGDVLTDVPVAASTDHGFFAQVESGSTGKSYTALTTSDIVPDPAAAEGANYGEWKSLGAQTTLTTNDSGVATAVVAIEKDAGFDDDGAVTAKVSFVVGGQTITKDVVFDSSNPLNPGEVKLTLADTQTVTVLPKAPIGETVTYVATATDQFGNLTDVPVALTDDTGSASTSVNTITTGFTNSPKTFTASATAAASQTITGTWAATTSTWTDAITGTAGFQEETALGVDGTKPGTKNVTGTTAAVTWYAIDLAASTYTLVHSGEERQPIGSTVTVTYKAVDQNGEPIQGLSVKFFRSGPDDQQDGEGNTPITTNANGEATYIFQGTRAGTATVTAVVSSGTTVIPSAQKTTTVAFGAAPKASINLKVSATSKGTNDVISINANGKAAGLTAVIYRGGKKIGTVKLNASGNGSIKVKDLNGSKKTTYTVKVAGTSATLAASKSDTVR